MLRGLSTYLEILGIFGGLSIILGFRQYKPHAWATALAAGGRRDDLPVTRPGQWAYVCFGGRRVAPAELGPGHFAQRDVPAVAPYQIQELPHIAVGDLALGVHACGFQAVPASQGDPSQHVPLLHARPASKRPTLPGHVVTQVEDQGQAGGEGNQVRRVGTQCRIADGSAQEIRDAIEKEVLKLLDIFGRQ
jgi:hypothetical protein